jgi:membrane fusion protein (multidrug efflux system)
VRVGDYVSFGPQFVVNTVSNIDNIRVRFTISEMEYLRITRLMQSMGLNMGERGDVVKMVLSDGTLYPLKGKMNFANREIDPSTGAMTLEAQFRNTGNLLRPGQYVKLKLVTDFREKAILIPQRAVIEMQGLFRVFVVADSNKVAIRNIKIGPTYNISYIVEAGLQPEDRIVLGGTQLLRDGSLIKPVETTWSPDSITFSSLK